MGAAILGGHKGRVLELVENMDVPRIDQLRMATSFPS